MSQHETSDHVESPLCLDDASYVLGSLSAADRLLYEKHLAGCSDCRASVARLAGLPGLLAMTAPAESQMQTPPLPRTLLPSLLAVAAGERRRRRWFLTGTIAAAAACIVALVFMVAVRPSTSSPAIALPPVPAVDMIQVAPGPMTASVQLSDRQWGTSIVINCHYAGTHDPTVSYQLVVFDAAGLPQQVGWWSGVNGSGSTVTTATSVRLARISRLEVQLPDGRPVLTAVPQHG